MQLFRMYVATELSVIKEASLVCRIKKNDHALLKLAFLKATRVVNVNTWVLGISCMPTEGQFCV